MKPLIAALLLTLAFAAPAHATTPPVPCAHQDGFLCGVLTVPLDRTGAVPGTIDLHYEIQATGPAPILLDLAGGPGQSELDFTPLVAKSLKPLLGRYRLAVLDQRGTGSSGALNCPGLQDESLPEPSAVADCAAKLGPARSFYTTVDSVLDIDDLRAALAAPTIAISGTSYGTYVATQYARAFPTHVDRLLLNSTVGLDGIGAFYQERFGALPRALRDACANGACRDATPTPVADVATLAHRLQAGHALRGKVYDSSGRGFALKIRDDKELAEILLAADAIPGLSAQLPGALRAAVNGDASALLRALAIISGAVSGLDDSFKSQSQALYSATVCQDAALPYGLDTPLGARTPLVQSGLAAVPPATYAPFSAKTVLGISVARSCEQWPQGTPRPRFTGPLPDVPTLLLVGGQDLRTPVESSEAVAKSLPRATIVTLAGAGHDVLDTGTKCVTTALTSFAADQPVGTPCAGTTIARPVAPRPPATLAAVKPAPGVKGRAGRVAAAVRATLGDLARSINLALANLTPLDGGGLHGGSWRTRNSDPATLTLNRYQYVPGVMVSGRPHPNSAGFSGRLTISGALAGTLTVDRKGHLRGTLGGVHVNA